MEALHAEIAERIQELDEARRQAEELLSPLSDSQLNWRPHEDRWSVGECALHVNAVNAGYLGEAERAIERARRKNWKSPGPYRYGVLGNALVDYAGPSIRLRLPAPGVFRPPRRTVDRGVTTELVSLLERLDGVMRSADGLDLGRTKLPSPAVKILRISLGQLFRLLPGHTRRHLVQARRVVEEPGFPK